MTATTETMFAQLCARLKVTLQDGETFAAFARRAALKANKADDAVWKALGDDLQVWANSVLEAMDQKKEFPALEGFPEAAEKTEEEGEPEAEKEAAEETEGEKTDDPSAPAGKRASKARKAAAAPPKTKAKPAKAAAKAKAPAKASAKAAKEKPAGKGRPSSFGDTSKIKILVKENPHRPGSFRDKNFKVLKSGMTVAEAVKAGCSKQQLWSLQTREVISIT